LASIGDQYREYDQLKYKLESLVIHYTNLDLQRAADTAIRRAEEVCLIRGLVEEGCRILKEACDTIGVKSHYRHRHDTLAFFRRHKDDPDYRDLISYHKKLLASHDRKEVATGCDYWEAFNLHRRFFRKHRVRKEELDWERDNAVRITFSLTLSDRMSPEKLSKLVACTQSKPCALKDPEALREEYDKRVAFIGKCRKKKSAHTKRF
jgi:hypothetical protein